MISSVNKKGQYQIAVIDGKEYKIKPGTLFFMTPVDFHSVDAKDIEIYKKML